jgi:integrase
MGRRTKKGDVGISNDNGRVRLRWRFRGERFSFNLPFPYKRSNLEAAKIRAHQIELEMLSGTFIPASYRRDQISGKCNAEVIYSPIPAPSFPTTAPSVIISTSPIQERTIQVAREIVLPTLQSLHESFNDWVKNIRSIKEERSNYYSDVRGLLSKWGENTIDKTPQLFGAPTWAASTFNSRLDCMSAFFDWLLSENKIPKNPLAKVHRRKKKKDLSGKREPMDENDLARFLCAIRDNTHCHPATTPRNRHSHYFPFFLFLALTGVRPAEAIGLRVKHVKFKRGVVEISETMARRSEGTHNSLRVRKETKMGNTRYLPITEELFLVLVEQVQNKKRDDLVFPSPTGLCIDDRMLARRVLTPVLKKLGIDRRVMYFFRHNFGTKAIEDGLAPTGVAYLMGHSTIETVMRNYVAVARSQNNLPKIVKKGTVTTKTSET